MVEAEIQLAYNIAAALGVGTVISGLAALAAKKVTWTWKKYLYTLGLTTISGLIVIEGVSEGVNADNAVRIALEIIGASFLANKLRQVGQKLGSDKEDKEDDDLVFADD